MTAMNLIVQSDTKAAYLLTDTARYSPDGTVTGFASKVFVAYLRDGSHAAFATSGMVAQDRWLRHLQRGPLDTIENLLRSVPAAFRAIEAELISEGVPARCKDDSLNAIIALHDAASNAVRGYGISNNRRTFQTRPGNAPYGLRTLAPMRLHLTQYVGRPIPDNADPCRGRTWRAETGAAALVEAQRADCFGLEPETFIGVGGQAVLTKVSAAGVSQTMVAAWGDCRGRRIQTGGERRLSNRALRALHGFRPWPMPIITAEGCHARP